MPAVNLKNFTANGSSDEVEWKGGKGAFAAKGSFGSGTVTLHAKFDETQGFVAVTSTALTAENVLSFELPNSAIVKAVLTGATSPNLNVTISSHIR